MKNFMMYKKMCEMNQKRAMFLIWFGLLAICAVVGGDSELRPNNTDIMQSDGE